jgi:bla regulator protein blaR1
MKKLIPWMIALAALPGSALFAQNLTGAWQGTLTPPAAAGKELRIVIKITTTDADTLKAVLYSIDQAAQGVPASSVTLQGSTFKMAIPGIGGSYEGKLSADGNSITGTFTQGPAPLPLNLTRATPATAWVIPEPPPPPKPMAADSNPAFEVATIKPSDPARPGIGLQVNGRQLSTLNTSVSYLIMFAYGIHARQITGGPAWVESDKYDIVAKADGEGQPNDKQWKIMLQKLLADRFKLTFHRDKKELSVYAITVGKTGPKLTKSEGDPNGLPNLGFGGLGKLNARNANIADFANLMQSIVLDRPVVDQTGITGRYDFALNWTPDASEFGGISGQRPPPAADADAPPDLFTAIQQQLGLKLESVKAPVEVIVIDKVEKPSAN